MLFPLPDRRRQPRRPVGQGGAEVAGPDRCQPLIRCRQEDELHLPRRVPGSRADVAPPLDGQPGRGQRQLPLGPRGEVDVAEAAHVHVQVVRTDRVVVAPVAVDRPGVDGASRPVQHGNLVRLRLVVQLPDTGQHRPPAGQRHHRSGRPPGFQDLRRRDTLHQHRAAQSLLHRMPVECRSPQRRGNLVGIVHHPHHADDRTVTSSHVSTPHGSERAGLVSVEML
jgi:hypothetical protein